MFPASREMGPPLEFPPRPMEIDLNISRTLPSPSTTAVSTWDSNGFQPQGFGDVSYPSSNGAKMAPLDNRASPQDPIMQWYTGNDGPWIPHKVIPEIVPGDRFPLKHAGGHNPVSYGNQYRQPNPSEAGSFQYGVPHSDSGYGTRRSVGNTSVFSADIPERDQDCQSLASHVPEFQQFQGMNEVIQQRDTRLNDSWNPSNPSDIPSLVCHVCRKGVKTPSELKYAHQLLNMIMTDDICQKARSTTYKAISLPGTWMSKN
jgi:hypothetical protein